MLYGEYSSITNKLLIKLNNQRRCGKDNVLSGRIKLTL